MIKFIKNRNGDTLAFDRSRIENVIEKAAQSVGKINVDFVEDITDIIIKNLVIKAKKKEDNKLLTIEEIQDEVEKALMQE